MKIRCDIARLLLAGRTDGSIARELGCDRKTAAKARAALGLPPNPRGKQSAPSLEAAFAARTKRLPGGHMQWTGYYSSRGVPAVRHERRQVSAYRIAFRIGNGRDPAGPVQPGCGMAGCVDPHHVEDKTTRRRTQATLAAIFGSAGAAA